MEKLLACLFLLVASFFTMLGNFWFTYGIWPQSWWSFAGFALLTITIQALWLAVKKD